MDRHGEHAKRRHLTHKTAGGAISDWGCDVLTSGYGIHHRRHPNDARQVFRRLQFSGELH